MGIIFFEEYAQSKNNKEHNVCKLKNYCDLEKRGAERIEFFIVVP